MVGFLFFEDDRCGGLGFDVFLADLVGFHPSVFGLGGFRVDTELEGYDFHGFPVAFHIIGFVYDGFHKLFFSNYVNFKRIIQK